MSRFRPLSHITELIIHCTATPKGQWFDARAIDGWHGERGFKRDPKLIGFHRPDLPHIGYHFVIGLKGGVESCRKLEETGAHARGHNAVSIGTCLVGTDRFTPEQWLSLKQHVQALQNRFPGIQIIGHNQLNSGKRCPGFDVSQWLDGGMRPLVEHLLNAPDGPDTESDA